MMKFEDYLKERKRIFAKQDANKDCLNLLWASNALVGETGEFANIVKKVYRDFNKDASMKAEEIISELGDIIWYWVFVCDTLKINPHDVLSYNMHKLKKRYGLT